MLPAEKNCHERCPVSKACYELYNCKGSHEPNLPYECPIYDKLMDILQEKIPFYDPDDIPEEEEEIEDDT